MKKTIFVAMIATSALATPAFAQDEADKGMYFQLRTGVADLNNPDLAIIDTFSAPNNRLDTKLNTKSAWTFGGELGYDFGGIRVGLELAYQRNKVKGITLKSLNGTAITAADMSDVVEGLGELDIISADDLDNIDINGTTISATNGSVAKLRQLAVMANVTYDIPVGGNTFKPYVGAGLGAVGSHLKALGEDDGSVRFAWQLRAGAAVKVTKGVDLTADYTFRQTSKGKLNFGDEDVEYRLGKTNASLFQVGLRFTL